MKVGLLRHTKIASFKELNVYCPGRTPRGTFVHRGVRETKFFAFRHFSILVKFDCFATLYKSLSVWAEALKA